MRALIFALTLFAAPALAAEPPRPASDAQIDFPGFAALTAEVSAYRESRLVSLETFKAMAGEKDTLILDARSAEAFAQGHIKGAVNLPFPDFNTASLKALIGDENRRVLIYCNNNFANDEPPVPVKALPLALNIPTFINLYGYGYKNIYELGDIVDFDDPSVGWVKG